MTKQHSTTQILVARVTVALIVTLAVAGVFWYGLSTDELDRLWRNVVARPGSPMSFRFILQPAMAALAAWRDGVADARLGREPYISAIIYGAEERGARMWEGIVSTARILILGVVMDLVFQVAFLGEFFPVEAAVIAVLLSFVPYALLRGPIRRIIGSRAVSADRRDN